MIAYIMVGLPGCGKTHYLKKNLNDAVVVSADNIKDRLIKDRGYLTDQEAAEVHELSVQEARSNLLELACNKTPKICMDGGGINNSYTENIIKDLKDLGYTVIILHFDTPVKVCLDRNAQRTRKVPVPEIEIVRKSAMMNECLIRYENLVGSHNIYRVAHYTNKHVFMDMDGTMAAYQHIPFDEYGCINFVSGRYFHNAKPVWPIIEQVQRLERNGSIVYVLSASPDNLCMEDKNFWLDKHVPIVNKEHRYFIGNKRYKFIMLRNICAKLRLDYKDVTFVDDDHQVITDCHKVGINGIHPSMFLADDFGN